MENTFEYINKKAGELAVKARDISKKNVLIAGGLPPQNGTYVPDDRDKTIIEKNFKQKFSTKMTILGQKLPFMLKNYPIWPKISEKSQNI